MVNKKDWKEFRSTGLVLIINQILHIFGWTIMFEIKNDEVKSVYPARIEFRGFNKDSTDEAYRKVSEYLKHNSEVLYKETINTKQNSDKSGEALRKGSTMPSACPNCKETMNSECACFRNKCVRCLEPVGNTTFTVCDECWDKEPTPQY